MGPRIREDKRDGWAAPVENTGHSKGVPKAGWIVLNLTPWSGGVAGLRCASSRNSV